jgi:hypothetical protein
MFGREFFVALGQDKKLKELLMFLPLLGKG